MDTTGPSTLFIRYRTPDSLRVQRAKQVDAGEGNLEVIQGEDRAGNGAAWLYTAAIFLNAFLLFLVQPLIAKRILPVFGGSPVVWNACLLFFQTTLLLGYLYAHASARRLITRGQVWLHLSVLMVGAVVLPIGLPDWLVGIYRHALATNPSSFAAQPVPMVLAILFASVGLPFFALSAGAPLIQRWFSDSNAKNSKNPYFLYSASNAGSLLALLAYPLGLEPAFTMKGLSLIWSGAYLALGCVMLACGKIARNCATLRVGTAESVERGSSAFVRLIASTSHLSDESKPEEESGAYQAPWRSRLSWAALAAGPSAALMGVTSYLSTNVAPMPLLWVAPLSLYLITFIAAFSDRFAFPERLLRPMVALAMFLSVTWFSLGSFTPIQRVVPLHLFSFFVIALAAHARASSLKPAAKGLTEFYLWISIGGAAGGFFAAILAPLIFRDQFELPVALAFTAFVLTWGRERLDRRALISAIAFAIMCAVAIGATRLNWHGDATRTKFLWLALAGGLLALTFRRPSLHGFVCSGFVLAAIGTQYAGYRQPLHLTRSFFGVHRVQAMGLDGYVHRLVHGNTVHGSQDARQPGLPLTYYSPISGVGRVFTKLGAKSRFDRVGIVGLGIGTLAAYGRPGQTMDLYELDPDVAKIASEPKLFTYLGDCRAEKRLILGDARLRLAEADEQGYGLLVLDAFASDAIPVHLLTREAFDLYRSKLRPDGLIAMHVSNKFVSLEPEVAALAASHGFKGWTVDTSSLMAHREHSEVTASRWVILARDRSSLGELARDPMLVQLIGSGLREWTDDYSDVLSAMRLRADR